MKNALFAFVLGLLLAIPLSVFASLPAKPKLYFPDVDKKAWYAADVYSAQDLGWMKGYANGNFGPENPVLRAELATILSRYDNDMIPVLRNLQSVICLNKDHSLSEAGLKVTDQDKYSEALSGFCETKFPPGFRGGCYIRYNAETGEYDEKSAVCA